jgi:hypothetical protein
VRPRPPPQEPQDVGGEGDRPGHRGGRRWHPGRPGTSYRRGMHRRAREAGGEAYAREAGVEHPAGSPVPIPYLIGVPRDGTAH